MKAYFTPKVKGRFRGELMYRLEDRSINDVREHLLKVYSQADAERMLKTTGLIYVRSQHGMYTYRAER